MVQPPRMLGRYEIQEEIGRGMMGVVYRAFDPALGRTVALKTVNVLLAVPDAERPAFEQRFVNEARVAAGLSHPGIVVVHDVGRDGASGSLYIALEYLEGVTLNDRVAREGPLPWPEALRLTARLAEALQHAHERGIVHRDVKPANIMVLPGGEPKLMDFGIAKVPASQLTTAGEFFGTPSYMSPEQAAGVPLDARSDLFSLGAVLYYMVTGARAFDAPSVPAILARVAGADPPPPSTVVPGLPSAVDAIVARALAKDPRSRYATARMMAEDARDVREGREPGHAGEWDPPPLAESTLASLVSEAPPPPASPGSPSPPAPASVARNDPGPTMALAREGGMGTLRRGGRGWLVLAALLALAVSFSLASRRPGASSSVLPLPVLPTMAPPAQLEVSFDHPLRHGTLRIYVDDELVAEEAFSGRVTKKILTFKMRKGSTRQVLEIEPGERVVRVEVDGAGYQGSKRIRGIFRSGETRRLEAAVEGLIKKDLSLFWGS